MMIIGFVPARCGSKSISLKNIKPFCGRLLIYWVLEALNEVPYDVGCLVNLEFSPNGSPLISRLFHLIDEPLRQEFIEERDEKMRIVAEQEDPGVAKKCPRDCPYADICGAT